MQNSDIYRSENDFWKIYIYRSIFDFHISVNISYSILTDICLHIPTDICRDFSFFDRFMKIYICLKWAILGFYALLELRKTSYIQRRISIYICEIPIILACSLYRSNICWVLIMTNIWKHIFYWKKAWFGLP